MYLGLDGIGTVFSLETLTRGRTLCFLARENQLRGMRSRWWDVVREMGEDRFWIMYGARKISLDLDAFSTIKRNL